MRVGAAGGLLVLAVAALGVGISAGPARAQSDPLLEEQWHLQARTDEPAGANVRPAWPLTDGLGVVIGIVDDGL